MTFAPRSEPLDFTDVDDVAAEFRKRGGRLTLPRRLVLEALFAADGPISAEYIASGGGGRSQRLESTSVYRNLERLEELGVVRHLHLGTGPGLYVLSSRQELAYLVCDRCGRITTVDASRLDRARDIVRKEVGYHAHFDHFPLHGLCDRCAKRAATRHPHSGRTGDHVPDHEHPHPKPHTHEHEHGDVAHAHPHTTHDHDHLEHEHEHSHGDYVHSHAHLHEDEVEEDHDHPHH